MIHGVLDHHGRWILDVLQSSPGWDGIRPQWLVMNVSTPLQSIILRTSGGITGAALQWLGYLARVGHNAHGASWVAEPGTDRDFGQRGWRHYAPGPVIRDSEAVYMFRMSPEVVETMSLYGTSVMAVMVSRKMVKIIYGEVLV